MPIIFVCGVPFGGGERLAKNLAQKLGYAYLSREDVVAKANECGIPVGKLEVAMIKRPVVQERMAKLKDRYLAVATATICEKAAQGGLVYYGRAGHYLLPGVSHVLRVRLIPEHAGRVEAVKERIKLSREKAEAFLKNVDDDIRSWVRFVHGVDMDDPSRYDFVVNLENVSLDNVATALCGIADLPDFRPTPASLRAMEDRLLQARVRIKLALDERTSDADITVRSTEGVVTITYMPRQAGLAHLIPQVLGDVPGCREIRCTMASTNILWVQEAFRADSETFRQVNELARRWGAAVELLLYKPGGEETEAMPLGLAPSVVARAGNGGVEDDVPATPPSPADSSFQETMEALVQEGRCGGGQRVSGGRERIGDAVNPSVAFSMVVVGDLFLEKPPAARTRLTRELTMFLAERMKAPVIQTGDLAARLHLGAREGFKAAAAAVLVVVIYVAVFFNQPALLDLLGGKVHEGAPWFSALAVALLAPVIALLYGTVLASVMKWLKMD